LNDATSQTRLGITEIVLRPMTAWIGFGLAVLLGLVSGVVPAWGAYRAKVTVMLRTV
jgi:ABC-type antimicrobial peptide transport system permease subunit